MKKIILTIFLLSFPINAIAYPTFYGKTDDTSIYLLGATNLSLTMSLETFAVLAHNKEYDKSFFLIQKCYQDYFRLQSHDTSKPFAPGLAECLGVDYSMTRSVNQANQQAEKEGRPKPYNIPFFEWSAFEKRIAKAAIPKNYIVYDAKDATTTKANSFSKTEMTQTGYSEYNLFVWLNYCPEKFNEMVTHIFSIP
ncbi:unnamed protein product [Commensalibacter communis]|uniref:hypothetical protein n=1 Tax=Commensalibacter communis TaxID=2972786 RepID=UPI0022FF6BB5|nr:hypothetical protein [Commensalibacter communis]CAI3958487.1 unnamed protein product [Commensalibacter communis]